MSALRSNLRALRQRLSWPDILALLFVAGGVVLILSGLSGGTFSFAKFLALLAGIYLLARLMSLWSQRLLWSLRNRLIVAYLFVALVPVLLVVLLSVQAAMILYTQLGGYLLYEDVQKRTDLIADGAEQIAAALRSEKGNLHRTDVEKIVSEQEHEVLDARLPGLQIEFPADPALLARVAGSERTKFSGLIQEGKRVDLVALDAVQTSRGELVVKLTVPLTPEFLATLAPDLDAVFFDVVEPYTGGARPGVTPRRPGPRHLSGRTRLPRPPGPR